MKSLHSILTAGLLLIPHTSEGHVWGEVLDSRELEISEYEKAQEYFQRKFHQVISGYCIERFWIQKWSNWYNYYKSPQYTYHIMWKSIKVCSSDHSGRLWVIPMFVSECWYHVAWILSCTVRNELDKNPICISSNPENTIVVNYWDCREK